MKDVVGRGKDEVDMSRRCEAKPKKDGYSETCRALFWRDRRPIDLVLYREIENTV